MRAHEIFRLKVKARQKSNGNWPRCQRIMQKIFKMLNFRLQASACIMNVASQVFHQQVQEKLLLCVSGA